MNNNLNLGTINPDTARTFKYSVAKYLSSGLAPLNYFSDIRNKCSANSFRVHFYMVKKYCKKNNLDFNMPDEFKLPIKDVVMDPPMLSIEQIKNMIQAIKKTDLDNYKALLAISTIYGLRCSEISLLTLNDINIEKSQILIRTRKGGQPKIHNIPSNIIGYLKNIEPIDSKQVLWRSFHNMCNLANIDSKGMGFHSIRRQLATSLIDGGVQAEVVMNFLRWAGQAIVFKYYRPEVSRIDETIWKSHPFLKFWS